MKISLQRVRGSWNKYLGGAGGAVRSLEGGLTWLREGAGLGEEPRGVARCQTLTAALDTQLLLAIHIIKHYFLNPQNLGFEIPTFFADLLSVIECPQ